MDAPFDLTGNGSPADAPVALPELDPVALAGFNAGGITDPFALRLAQAFYLMQRSRFTSFCPLLPLFLSLDGRPFTLRNHFPFEPFFRTRMARKTIFMVARQLGKSSAISARGIVRSACTPWFKTLFIAPLFEQIRRLSQLYVGPLIEQSPVRDLLVSTETVNSVLQRTFLNNSRMLFSFAGLDCGRTRGISTDVLAVDEIQNLAIDHLSIIRETMSGSHWGGIEEFAGTPLSLENTMAALWSDSSQAEWVVRCRLCGYWNVPALSHDLERMIGPCSSDISPLRPGVICAKCRRPRSIEPREGRWIHAYPSRRWTFVGYHIPQLMMPMHYGSREKWSTLVGKREGKGNTPINVFYNEVCAESYDTGSRLITLTELQAASTLPWSNDISEAVKHLHEYTHRVLACDWGGGGQDGVSYTALAVLGIRASGKIDVLWGKRSLTPHDHEGEAALCLRIMGLFQCQVIAHDYTGAGSLRETFIVQAGIPYERVINISYIRASASARVMVLKPPTKLNPRPYWQVDKSRSLLLVCSQIRNDWIHFFQWDRLSNDDKGLISDFLALVDEKVDSRIGKDIYAVTRDPHLADDFAQAVNIGCCTLWHMSEKWPDIAGISSMRAAPEAIHAMEPVDSEVKFG